MSVECPAMRPARPRAADNRGSVGTARNSDRQRLQQRCCRALRQKSRVSTRLAAGQSGEAILHSRRSPHGEERSPCAASRTMGNLRHCENFPPHSSRRPEEGLLKVRAEGLRVHPIALDRLCAGLISPPSLAIEAHRCCSAMRRHSGEPGWLCRFFSARLGVLAECQNRPGAGANNRCHRRWLA